MKNILTIILAFAMALSFAQQNQSDLDIHNANEYLLAKCQKYGIVILGENHWIKNELMFFKKVIPLLYKHGIKCFAFEFLSFTAQDKINSLINAEKFSKPLLDSIISEKPQWYIQEYMELLYTLWKINQTNKDVTVLALDVPNYFPISINNDSVMADIVVKYYSETKNKILIYCGRNHGFTKFHQCRTPSETIDRLGNIVYHNFPNQVTNISFFPIIYQDTDKQYHQFSYIVNSKKTFGMDLKNSPISESKNGFYYLQKCDNYSIGNFYDGAIFINKKIRFCKPNKKLSEEDRKSLYDVQRIITKTSISNIYK
jgi:hypothetical protein